ncbi:MAG: hypothetical protein AAFV19_18575 [Pseudomonadota bacterium]
MGVTAPAPRITRRAVMLASTLIGFPLVSALLLFDGVIWLAVKMIWGGCYGLWCWI